MTIVDHRVLVNAPPDIVWELLGDLTATPKWHINCSHASILTTQQEGVGVRCRLNMETGPDLVQEILSWYNNLGYEYTVVDGPYRASRGRVRLQAIPEGTVVQWTLEYELAGFAAGMRNLSTRRRVDNEIEGSLKRLKKLVESAGIRMDSDTRDRVSMRPAPTAKERAVMAENIARTQPAMPPVADKPAASDPTVVRGTPPVIDEGDLPPVPQPLVIDEGDLPPAPDDTVTDAEPITISEPALDDEDTRPNPVRVDDDVTLPNRPAPTPDKDTLPVEPAAETVTIPAEVPTAPAEQAPVVEEPVTATPLSEQATLPDPQEVVDAPVTVASTPPVAPPTEAPPEPAPPPQRDAEEETADTAHAPDSAPDTPAEPAKSIFEESLDPVGPSIWDVFGMSAPSAEDAAQSVPPENPAAPAPTPEKVATARPLQPRQRTGSHPGLSQTLQRRARTRQGDK